MPERRGHLGSSMAHSCWMVARSKPLASIRNRGARPRHVQAFGRRAPAQLRVQRHRGQAPCLGESLRGALPHTPRTWPESLRFPGWRHTPGRLSAHGHCPDRPTTPGRCAHSVPASKAVSAVFASAAHTDSRRPPVDRRYYRGTDVSGSAHSHATADHIHIESAPVTCFGQFPFYSCCWSSPPQSH